MKRYWPSIIGLANILFVLALSTHVAAQDFYKGKTVRLIVGAAPGGGFDTYSRVISRHMGKHVPGNPTFVVDNMPGAGHLIAANHLFKVAKPDGLTMGNFIGGLFLQQALGRAGIEFDSGKFEFIGVPVKDSTTCALTKASGITNMEQWFAAKTPIKVGGNAPGSATYDNPKILQVALGLPVQVVAGYKGTAEARLAVDSGELGGICGWAWESLKATWTQRLASGDALVVLQTVPKPHSELPNVPLAINYEKTPEARELINVGIHDLNAVLRAYVLPPGTPKDRVGMIRKAFMDTLKDPEFLAEAHKSKLDVDPVTGDELESTVKSFFKVNPVTLAKLKEILK
ncbi:MAG: tripartite tricarboxylate transporter substrate-binding protein [Deltaproteobacteria bacterium]|nr:tripartite tricarboxylate transporter substrate-binding protein [Deltaproteobacteria bacterium]